MGDRFYKQQLQRLGACPGSNQRTRKRNMSWDQDKKDAVVAAYEKANPTPETSVEITKDLADEFNESPNGVRMVLSKAGVYVKKAPASGASKSSGTGTTRISKADAQAALSAAIVDAGHEVDEDVVSKLTGKAAVYFTKVLAPVVED